MAKGKVLGRDAILAVQDIQTEAVEVPEWGGTVYVRGMTGSERDAFEESVTQGRGRNQRVTLENFRAKLLVRTLVNEAGERLFGDDEVEALGRKSAAAVQRVFDVAARLSGLGTRDIEELTKN